MALQLLTGFLTGFLTNLFFSGACLVFVLKIHLQGGFPKKGEKYDRLFCEMKGNNS